MLVFALITLNAGAIAIGWAEVLGLFCTVGGFAIAYDKHTRELEAERKVEKRELLNRIDELRQEIEENKERDKDNVNNLRGAIAKVKSDLAMHKEVGHKHCPIQN